MNGVGAAVEPDVASSAVSGASAALSAPAARGAAIRAAGIVKHFGHIQALRRVSIAVHAGEIVALVGDNGAGKSTLAKVICGSLQPDEGQISFWDQPVAIQSITHAHELGLYTVYQDLAQAPDLTVAENFYLGRELYRGGLLGQLGVLDRRRMEGETRSALDHLGIRLKTISAPVRELSGGQRQALAVARATAWATTGLIMDEPTAALGTRQTGMVYEAIQAAAGRGLAVLVISHDIPRVLAAAHRVAVMRHGLVIADLAAVETSVDEVIGLMLGSSTVART
jgi:simple sugar transport system ATP-binding protein